MSRLRRLLLPAGLALLALGVGAPPARALPAGFVPPVLPSGSVPLGVDEDGFSPDGKFLVFQEGGILNFERTLDDVVTYQQPIVGETLVGFLPFDERVVLLEAVGASRSRLRVANPDTGKVLFDRVLNGVPAVLTNLDGSVLLILETRDDGRVRVTILRANGKIAHQRTLSAEGGVAVNPFGPTIVFTEPQAGGTTLVELVDRRGRLQQRETAGPGDLFGFDAGGTAFVLAQPTAVDAFRVKLTRAVGGRLLFVRNFTGPLSVGFSPDGTLLGIDTVVVTEARTLFFRTNTGRQVF